MKKLTFFLSVLLAMAVFAFAASAAPVNYTANEDGSFDVSYTGTAGEYYALVIVEGIAAEGTAPVSGTVTSVSAKEAKVTLTSTSDGAKVFTVDTASGSYTISVPADTYKFVVTKAAHLSYTKNELEVKADVAKDVELKGGDTNADGVIDITDLGKLLNTYNSDTDLVADVNGDGVIDVTDLGKLLNNYNAIAVVE